MGQRSGCHWRHVVGSADAAYAKLHGHLANHLVGFRMLREGDEGSLGAKDAGFFPSDGCNRGAEPLCVVEGDIGDYGDEGIDDVGGVEPATHAHLEDRKVNVLFGEVEQGLGGEHFKKTGKLGKPVREDELLRCIVDAEIEGGEAFVGDFDAVQTDALVDASKMWRGVKAGEEAGAGEDGGER